MEPLIAIELDNPHDVLLGHSVHAAALPARVDERVESDFRQHTRATRRGVRVHVEEHSARQVVGLDLVSIDQLPDLRRTACPRVRWGNFRR